MGSLIRFIINMLLAVDQLANTLLWGHPDETLSSRLGRTVNGNHRYFWVLWFRMFVDCMFFFDNKKTFESPGVARVIRHCEKSVMPLEQQNFREVSDYEVWSWSKGVPSYRLRSKKL